MSNSKQKTEKHAGGVEVEPLVMRRPRLHFLRISNKNYSFGFYKFYKQCGCLAGRGFCIPGIFSLYVDYRGI